MYWAAHGNTAAEVIYTRIDAAKPNLGLTNSKGNEPTLSEIEIAKKLFARTGTKLAEQNGNRLSVSSRNPGNEPTAHVYEGMCSKVR